MGQAEVLKSEKNKKQAINALAFALAAINSEKKLSDEDLKKVSGGTAFLTSAWDLNLKHKKK